MTLRQYILFLIPACIWGSTWYVIKFQLGHVDPMASVAYRFMLAGISLLAFCKIAGKNLKFNLQTHGLMTLLGASLFGINYWMVYKAEETLSSGAVAIIFSFIIFFNIFFNALLLKGRINKQVVFAAILGVGGTALLYKDELKDTLAGHGSGQVGLFLLCIAGVVLASLGNILSAYKQKKGTPVLQTNAFAMIYGSLLMFILCIVLGKPLTFDLSRAYILSLGYLAVFGSIVAFSSYLKLLGEIGPDRAIYVALLTPAIALIFSTLFEDYQWPISSCAGVVLLFAGNFLALLFKKHKV